MKIQPEAEHLFLRNHELWQCINFYMGKGEPIPMPMLDED
jgi:hypothetical protein